jgi:adenylate cyclase
MGDHSGETFTLNGVTVDFAAQRVRDASGAEVPLRAQSLAVLRHLIENAGRAVSKDELIAAVWGGIAVTDDSLVQCVRDVRRALGDESQRIVRTVPRRGYRLDLPEAMRPSAPSRRTPLFAAAALALLALVAVVLWQTLRPPAPAAAGVPVVAVLPFENMSPDPALDYLGRGVAEDLIAMLARAPDMAVVSALSSFPFGSTPVDPRAVGTELGAGYLLAGGVRREGDRLRLTAQLIDAETGQHLWAERFDRAGTDPLALQDEIAGRVVGALTGERGLIVRSQYRAAWGKDTAQLGEYDYYLRGHAIFIRIESRATNDEAGRIWADGLAHYPDSALLKVKLGWHHAVAVKYLWSDNPAADIAAADRLAREVLSETNLSPLVERLARWLRAFLLLKQGNDEAALAEARRTVEMGPNDAWVLWALTDALLAAGETEQSAAWLERAAALDPRQHALHAQTRGYLYYRQGRYEHALAEFARAGPLFGFNQAARVVALMRLGRADEARAAIRSALEDSPGLSLTAWRATYGNSEPAFLEAELADLAAAGLPE